MQSAILTTFASLAALTLTSAQIATPGIAPQVAATPLAAPRVHRNVVTIGATTLGNNTFIGNHAVIPAGHVYPHDFFVGVSTVANASIASADSAWFGHPPMQLPRREVVQVDRSLERHRVLLKNCPQI